MKNMCTGLCVGLLVPFLVSLALAAKAPDIPTGSKIFLENRGKSDESQMFTELFREKLSKDETSRNYSKPGFPVVDKKEDAEYILRFIVVMRENERSFMEGPQEHARVNIWLLDSKGTVVWEHNYDCVRVFREPARECYQHISDDLKAAQVNAQGKRAGWLGWKKSDDDLKSDGDKLQRGTALQNGTASAPQTNVSDATHSVGKATLEISSDPLGADIELDGNFVGNTPSSFAVAAGDHTLIVLKNGYGRWERKLRVSAGNVTVMATLNGTSTQAGPEHASPMSVAPLPDSARSTDNQSSALGNTNGKSTQQMRNDTATPTATTVVAATTDATASALGASSDENPAVRHDGVTLSRVVPGGPCDKAGILPGDVLLAIDDHYVFTVSEMYAEIRRHKVGAQVSVRYRRRSLTYEVSVKLAAGQ